MGGGSEKSDGSSFLASKRTTRWTGKRKKKDGSNGGEQSGDGSGTGGCRKLDTGTASAGASESSESDSSRERDGRISSNGEQPSVAMVEVTSRYTYKEDTDERWNEYVRAEIASSVIVHRKETRGSGEGSLAVGSAEPLDGQSVAEMVRRATRNAEPRGCRQGERETCLHVAYHRRVSRGSEVVGCAILMKICFDGMKSVYTQRFKQKTGRARKARAEGKRKIGKEE